MNTGYVLRSEYDFDADEVEQAGQRTTDGEWDWLATPTQAYTAEISDAEDNVRALDVVKGEATWTQEEEVDKVTVNESGRISTRTKHERERYRANWMVIPEANVAVLSDPKALYYAEAACPPIADFRTPKIDVPGVIDNVDTVDVWGAGFPARGIDNGARKGAVYGKKVLEDPDIGEDLARSPLNQAGFRHITSLGDITAYVAESGYVAAWSDDLETSAFAHWVVENIEPHLRDDSDGNDDAQETLDEAAETDGGDEA